ncbi:OmpA family protein [Myxococcota bacterium]|nr:OmpA family protein [Myxococcota bacterium]
MSLAVRALLACGLVPVGAALAGPAAAAPGDGPTAPRTQGSAWAWGAVGEQARPDLVGGGLGAALGLRLARPLYLDLAGEAGLDGQAEPWLGARPELRLFLAPRLSPEASLSLTLGGGLRWAGPVHPDLSVGAALDLPGGGRLQPRVQARYLLDPTGGGSTLQAGVGLAWPRPAAPTPAPPVEAAATPAPPGPPARLDWTWVPHPISACVDTRLLGERGGAQGDGSDRPPSPLDGVRLPDGLDLQALLQPTQGSLIVVALPGDQVEVAGRPVRLAADATAVTHAPEGPIEVRIRGAGQLQVLQPAIAGGYAVWVRSRPDPTPVTLSFAQGSAELTAADREVLVTLAQNAGDWRFELRGSFSPEGDLARNRALALARAEAVRDALLAAGLPPTRVQVAAAPDQVAPDQPPASQRACTILPLPPEAR